jgi:hypothetical protein
MRQVRAFDKAPEALDILAPVRHQLRLVEQIARQGLPIDHLGHRRLLGEADEHGHSRADALNWFWTAVDFLDVDTRRKIFRHTALLSLTSGLTD